MELQLYNRILRHVMKKIIRLISIVAMTLFSALSLQGQGFMTISCENKDEDDKVSLYENA
jgi:hypothetical protein